MPLFPDALLTTVIFAAEEGGATRLTVTCEPYGDAAAAGIAAFLGERPGMTLGWTASFDALERELTRGVGVG